MPACSIAVELAGTLIHIEDGPILNELKALIREHGWAVRLVASRLGEEGVPFAYTVALTAMGHPEIVEQGLPNKVGHEFLNLVSEMVRSGRRFHAPSIVTDLTDGGQPIAFVHVKDTSDLTAVEQVYGAIDALRARNATYSVAVHWG